MLEKLRMNIPFAPDEQWLLERLHCTKEERLFSRAMELYAANEQLFNPAYLVREFAIAHIDAQTIALGGQQLHSRVGATKLSGLGSVYVFIATCGQPINRLVEMTEDMLDQYLLDQLAYAAYLAAQSALAADVEPLLGRQRLGVLCPGSIVDWSVDELKLLFSLLDGLHQPLGLRVLGSGLIEPLKSTCGLIYPTDEHFESCSLCPRPDCEGRRAPYDEEQRRDMCGE